MRKTYFGMRILRFELRAIRFSLHERSKLQRLGLKLQDQVSSLFFQWGTPPPVCLLR